MLKAALNQNTHKPIPPSLTADNLNDYFTSVGAGLAKGFSDNLPDWSLPISIYTFKFAEISQDFVHKELKHFEDYFKLDVCNMDTRLLNIATSVITPSLIFLLNWSLSIGYVPQDWKIGKVTPIFKGRGNNNLECNYRPISVLSQIAKILEKAVHAELFNYLLSHNFISADQSAFRKQHSTQTALHRVVDDWLESMKNGEITALCMFDLRKCFHTINHEALLFKMSKYGIIDTELQWFTSYLCNRKQQVSCNGCLSDLKSIDTGIHQGSNLGPLLFLIYINDFTSFLPDWTINLYVDDILVYISDINVINANARSQSCVNVMTSWFNINKLTVNTDKTYTMLISSQSHKDKDAPLSININGIPLVQQKVIYLGVTIDSHLTWVPHINSICKN